MLVQIPQPAAVIWSLENVGSRVEYCMFCGGSSGSILAGNISAVLVKDKGVLERPTTWIAGLKDEGGVSSSP